MEFDWANPFVLEMKVADIISRQAKHGVQINERNARWNIHSLTERIVRVDHKLIPLLPKMMNKGTEYRKPFKLNGQFMKYPGEYADRVGLDRSEVGGPFTAVWYTPFDASKSARVKSVMLDMGWIPTEWNTKKMPFQTYKYRKQLTGKGAVSYAKFINTLEPEEREFFEVPVNGFIKAHFVNKSKNYMKAVLVGLGFDLTAKTPTFDQIKRRLILNNKWITSPKITEDSFESLSEDDSEALTLLKARMVWAHRRSMIQGLVENIRADGKISAEANPCATPTARFKHRIVVNIPAAGAVFGEKCRSMFEGDKDPTVTTPRIFKHKFLKLLEEGEITEKEIERSRNRYFHDGGWHPINLYVRKGHQAFVGYDGAGLELRMLAHYMIKECKEMLEEATAVGNKPMIEYAERGLKSALEYREVLLNGDIHSHNQRLAGLPTRKAAKAFIYGFNYGAGDAKLGELVNGGKEEGAKIRETFLRENPCIAILIDRMQKKGESGYLIGLDGRKLWLRVDENGKPQTHKALNLTLQSAGAIVMKYGMCFLNNWAQELRAHKVLDIHDEGQWTCHPDDTEALAKYMSSCVRRAGEFLKMECPLSSDAMIGANWYHTH